MGAASLRTTLNTRRPSSLKHQLELCGILSLVQARIYAHRCCGRGRYACIFVSSLKKDVETRPFERVGPLVWRHAKHGGIALFLFARLAALQPQVSSTHASATHGPQTQLSHVLPPRHCTHAHSIKRHRVHARCGTRHSDSSTLLRALSGRDAVSPLQPQQLRRNAAPAVTLRLCKPKSKAAHVPRSLAAIPSASASLLRPVCCPALK